MYGYGWGTGHGYAVRNTYSVGDASKPDRNVL